MIWGIMSFIWVQINSQKEKEAYLLPETRQDWTDEGRVYVPLCWVIVLCDVRVFQCKGNYGCTKIYFQSHIFNVKIDVLSEHKEYHLNNNTKYRKMIISVNCETIFNVSGSLLSALYDILLESSLKNVGKIVIILVNNNNKIIILKNIII